MGKKRSSGVFFFFFFRSAIEIIDCFLGPGAETRGLDGRNHGT